jgi:pimeloyl-ACP methyl ester carboxylesterase
MSESTFRLPDGRTLAYHVDGDGEHAVLFLPGFMASRLTGRPAGGARVVTVDRPGIGGSDAKRGRTLVDFVEDVAALANHLSVDRFAVLGHSAGAPYAAAIAQQLPDRVAALGIACGFAPLDRPGATAAMHPRMARGMTGMQRAPWMARLVTASLPRQYRKEPAAALHRQFGQFLCASDAAAITVPETRAALLAAAVESTRQGGAGLALEMQLVFGRPWGFEPRDINVPTWLWYGADDTLTPPQMGEYLASQVPNAKLVVYPGEGHMAAFTHWDEIVTTLR